MNNVVEISKITTIDKGKTVTAIAYTGSVEEIKLSVHRKLEGDMIPLYFSYESAEKLARIILAEVDMWKADH